MSTATTRLRRAGVGGLAALVAFGGVALTATSASADWAETGGAIRLVDTDTTAGTQGATLIQPGAQAAPAGDIQLLIPNSFKAGDTIHLAIADRSVSEDTSNSGTFCQDAAHSMGFAATPTVAVSGAYATGTGFGAQTAATDASSTTVPAFTTTLLSSSRCAAVGAKDIVSLTVTNAASGTAADEFVITVSGITYNTGASVTGGAIHVIPTAFNGNPTTGTYNPSPLFGGNLEDDPTTTAFDPVLNTYTVNAYVSPVQFTAANTQLVADGTNQSIGNLTIKESVPNGMQPGTYYIWLPGIGTFDTSNPQPTVTVTGGAGDETAALSWTNASPGAAGHPALVLTTAETTGTDNLTTAVTFTISGLRVNPGTATGTVQFALTGGTVDHPVGGDNTTTFLAQPAGSGAAIAPSILAEDTAAAPTDIQSPLVTAAVTSVAYPMRIGGNDRYETAAKVAAQVSDCGQNGYYYGYSVYNYAVLASGENFPDALAASYLAGVLNDRGPAGDDYYAGSGIVLLTKPNSVPDATRVALRELGVRHVYIVGGTGAVSAAVEDQLKQTRATYCGGENYDNDQFLDVQRVGGKDRYETARLITAAASALGGDNVGRATFTFGSPTKYTAIVATGTGYADALAGGPIAYSERFPLLLTQPTSLSSSAASALRSLDIEQVLLLGGTGAVSQSVEDAITAMGIKVIRLSGATRYATATALASFELAGPATGPTTSAYDGGLGWSGSQVYLARGDLFPDALAGAVLGAPILLTTPTALQADTQTWLVANKAAIDWVTALGLGGAVSNAALNAAVQAVAG